MTARTTERVLTTLEEIDAVADAWRELERHCADPFGYFQTFDWCRNWVAQFCDGDAFAAHVVTVWAEDRLVALWPMMIVESAGITRRETLGVPHTQYCGALIRPEYAHNAEVAQRLRTQMQPAECDVALSRAVFRGSALDRLLADTPEVRGTANAASMLDLSGYASPEAYTAQLGKLQRRNRNRRRNHLARLGALEFSVIWPGDPEFASLVQMCTQMKRRWLAETDRYSVGFSIAGYEEFLARLSGDRESLSGACLSVLRAGGRIVALELGFIHFNHYYAYVGGFDWDLRQLSPGKVQMELTVMWLIEQRISAYDLLINPEDYKNSWTNRNVEIACRAEALSWKGMVYASVWLPTVRPALKRLHSQMPTLADRAKRLLRPAA